ncbi:hypothetical protein GCM10027592_46960 [Spirosoma flavus]
MKKYITLILLTSGLATSGIFLKAKLKKDRAIDRVEALNQLRFELIRRKVLRSAQAQQTFSVSNINAIVERLDTLPVREPELLSDTLSNKVLMEKYNYELYALYGLDNRVDISCRGVKNRNDFLNSNDQYIARARAVCALIPKRYLTLKGNVYELTAGTLNETKFTIVKPCSITDGVCFNNQIDNELIKYANQRVGAHCSGFGYQRDLVVTANHCFDNSFTPDSVYYVFGFVYYPGLNYHLIPREDVYTAIGTVAQSVTDDFRIIRVNRQLQSWQRAILNRDDLEDGNSIYMAGHPDGLPLKLTLDAQVYASDEATFFTDLDAFHGNSGSPVFNELGQVIGILLRGDKDYEKAVGGCVRYYKSPENYGEQVLRVNRIP